MADLDLALRRKILVAEIFLPYANFNADDLAMNSDAR
jgi:hypothetical protein